MAEQSEQHALTTDMDLRNRFIAEATTEGIVAHEDGLILAVNEALRDIYGYEGDELLGADVYQLILEDEHTRVKELVAQGQDKPYETIGARKDGSTFPLRVAPRIIEIDGHRVRALALRDLTEQKEVEETIRSQSQALMEMSTPAIRIWDGMLLMPLVGAIDTTRSQQIITAMLESIASSDIDVAILDVTGVPFIDTSVARHILQAVEGAKILGANVIVSGFSPEAAQTLAQLGVDFSSLRTCGSLRAAMELAFTSVGLKIG